MMLRPFKTILTYLQLNTNALASEMNQQSDPAIEIVSTEGSSEKSCNASNNPNATSSPIKSPLKTPHDQNENEVVIVEDECQSNKEKEDEDPKTAKALNPAVNQEVIDITDAAGSCLNEKNNASETVQTGPAECDGKVIDQEAEEMGIEIVELDRSGSSQLSESVNLFSDEDKDSDVCFISEGAVQTTHIDSIVLSDNENAEDESKNETIDLSLESNEVIILEEVDHNDSFSDPLNDPLAIDDYTGDANSSIPVACTSRGNSDPSNEGELLFELETRAELGASNSKASGKPTHRKKNDSFTEANVRDVRDVSGEEHEVRSDGSDSGLGSETSTLQSNNSSIATDSPVCKPAPAKGNLKRRSDETLESTSTKRAKSSLNFNGVKVYYFPRIQGFGCVPSQGGCTLGMGAHHVQMKTFTLAEHTAEQRRVHKQQMQEINPRTSSSDETDSDEEISEASGSDLDADASGFLQPVSPRQRRAILKAAGIRKIDSTEKDECRSIRSSREFCGCSCRGYCDPDTCSCSQSGIKCQVDRPSFPCGCTRDGCANVVGRVEFNPSRVRTHYIHTIMRLDIENKQKRAIDMEVSSPSSQISNYNSNTVTSTLSNLCTYNTLVTTNHMRHHQAYSAGAAGAETNMQQQTHDNYVNHNNDLYPSVGSSIMPMTSTNSSINASTATLLRQRLLEQSGNVGRQGNSNRNANDRFTVDLQCATSRNHDLDLHYEFRADSGATVDLTSPSPSNDLLGLGDYNSTSTVFQETYNGHSFLNQNYTNPTFCQTQNLTTYQQGFVGYVPPSDPSEVADLTTELQTDTSKTVNTMSDSSYVTDSSAPNQAQLDGIKNYLHSHRDLTVTTVTATSGSGIETPTAVTLNMAASAQSSTSVTAVTLNMAPSAQTSTSVTAGTLTTVTLPKVVQSTNTFNPINPRGNIVVDLTDRVTPEEEIGTRNNESSSSVDIIEILEGEKDARKERDPINNSSVETMKTKPTRLENLNNAQTDNVLDSQSDIDLTISENTSISSAASVEENLIVGTAIA